MFYIFVIFPVRLNKVNDFIFLYKNPIHWGFYANAGNVDVAVEFEMCNFQEYLVHLKE